MKSGAVLFEIENTPYVNKVKQLAEVRHEVERKKADVALSDDEIASVTAQLDPAK